MDFCFGQGDRDAQYPPAAVSGDADGHENGAIDDFAAFTHALVPGIEDKVRRFVQRPFTPGGKPNIQLLGGTADLSGGNRDFRTKKGLQNSNDFPS